MVICDRIGLIYVGPPKTATTSLHHWFSQPALCSARWSPQKADQHCMAIPPDKRHYTVIASVRAPLDRCVSMWRQFTSPSSLAKLPECFPLTFPEFVEAMPSLAPFYRLSQSQWLAGVPRMDKIVRVGRLDEDLRFVRGLCKATLEALPVMNRSRAVADGGDPHFANAIMDFWRADEWIDGLYW